MLIDPAAVAAWRASPAVVDHADLIVFAGELPELVADAVLEAFRQCDGPGKAATAGVLAATWYVITLALLDRLRRVAPDLRDPDERPEQIDHLRSLCGRFGTMNS